MTKLQLGFKAFDAHELLCHFVATKAGLYRREKLEVELRDITFIADNELPSGLCQASCGAALASAIRGLPQRVVLVATDRPMFWIHAQPRYSSLAMLAGASIATFPAIAPPHHLANMILGKAGIDVQQALTLHAARDDVARIGLLRSGSVDAAVISSALSPLKVQAGGFNQLCFFGDEVRIPTTGLAVDEAFLDRETTLVQAWVALLREALALVQSDPELVGAVLTEYFDVGDSLRTGTADLYRQYYSSDGRTSAEIAQQAVLSMCKSLAITAIPDWQSIYRFDL